MAQCAVAALRGHLPAFVGATPARLRTLLAVIVLVLGALVAACLAHVRADATDLFCQITAAGHVPGGEAADGSAVHIEGDAARHHLDVRLLQAGCRTVVTGVGAGVARRDAGLVLLMHGELLRVGGDDRAGGAAFRAVEGPPTPRTQLGGCAEPFGAMLWGRRHEGGKFLGPPIGPAFTDAVL
jgi:hypothetical protein